ncbi:Hypothetical predicted protein [Octopus vulgaris]|uniref:Uncharacterized protein n=1 Tax=Octopus vulgaris TaxID=6645 RepID=A0AA36AWN1_OCTVU|nr:Hypothetical predicted protein [Octopus vulgaris]
MRMMGRGSMLVRFEKDCKLIYGDIFQVRRGAICDSADYVEYGMEMVMVSIEIRTWNGEFGFHFPPPYLFYENISVL